MTHMECGVNSSSCEKKPADLKAKYRKKLLHMKLFRCGILVGSAGGDLLVRQSLSYHDDHRK